LFVLSLLIDSDGLLLPIGNRIAAVSIISLWCIFAIFKVMKTRWLIASAISLLFVIPVSLIINFILSGFVNQPVIDVWDVLAFSIIIVLAFVLFCIDYYLRKGKHLNNKDMR